MVAYNKGDLIPEGTRVRVSPSTAPFSGLYGTVVQNGIMGRRAWSTFNPGTRITYVKLEDRDEVFGYYTDNLERIEDMRKTTLIGPKPEPVKEPEFVAPFRPDGSNVVDANGTVVFKVLEGGYKVGACTMNLPMSKRYELARVVTDALNEKFPTTVKDSNSPF